ncbi:MAG: hypothetical protein K8W52_36645 [Deltaproteobacteria bacterium]|nr:hypothetical protein [Deltaproteobacteria bacterium]
MTRGAAALLALALAACGPRAAPSAPVANGAWPPPPADASLADKVIWDFERATLAGQDRWVELFDFDQVGAFEILMHRYDLLGRLPKITDKQKAEYAAEDATPYPAAREKRNVGRYFNWLVKPRVGTGGCAGGPPHWNYNKLLATYDPLPPGNEIYEPLRQRVNAQLVGGGVIGIRCSGGKGGLALVYSPRDNARGYALVTIYDDGVP